MSTRVNMSIITAVGAKAEAGLDAARTIEAITEDILECKSRAGEAILRIGQCLIEAKEMLPHGEWLPWLEERVEFSQRTAQNFMRLAREWTNTQVLADLGYAKALTLLALPPAEREEFLAEEHVVSGEVKSVTDMSARELEKAVKERDAALRQAELDRAEKDAAEQARKKMAVDLTFANERLAGLRNELEELRSRPVDVAVEVDQEAIDKARDETRLKVESELKAAQAEAGRQVSEANAAAAAVKTELQKKQREVEDLQFELDLAKKRLAAKSEPANPSPLSTDADLAQFKLLFDQAQNIVNQMRGLLLRVRGRDDKEKAGRLAAALKALAENVGRCAE